MFPDPFIFALMESLAKTSASPEPLIVIVADLDLISLLIKLPDPLIFAISVWTSPFAVISPEPLIFNERLSFLKSIIFISPEPEIETSSYSGAFTLTSIPSIDE